MTKGGIARIAVAICSVAGWDAAAGVDLSQRPEGTAARLVEAPELDGDVASDPAWRNVVPMTGFTQFQPNNGDPASERTEVFMGFTAEAVYIGVICYERDPEAITSSNNPFQSDSILVLFDTFRTEQTGVVFGTNPMGVEYDGQISDGFSDWNWSTVWEVRTAINEDGWSAEFEIPFSSLRYGRGQDQRWGVNLERVIRRNNEIANWASVPRQMSTFRMDLAGEVGGLRVPEKRPRNLKLMPYALGSIERAPGTSRAANEDAGLDLKYSITPSLTLDVTYNTDFAQVEADQQQVNFGRFSLFFPETRPFFLENAAAFEVGIPGATQLFFSRRIGIAPDGRRLPIDGGLRLSGKVGNAMNLGFLRMRAAGADAGTPHNDFTVARVKRDLPNRSSIGAIATSRDDGLTAGRTYGIDGTLGIGFSTTLAGFIARTDSDQFDGDDYAVNLFGGHNSPKWQYNAAYTEVGAGFNPEVGFVGRRGYRRLGAFLQRTYAVDDFMGLNEWKPHVAYTGFWDFDGYHESGFLHMDSWMVWKNGADLWTAVNVMHEGVKQAFPIAGNTVPAGDYDYAELNVGGSVPRTGRWQGGGGFAVGGFYNGNRVSLFPFLNYRQDETLTAFASWNYNAIDLPTGEPFKVNLARVGFNYSFTPKVRLRALVQYNDADEVVAANVRFSWLRSGNAGLFLVYNEVDDRSGAPMRSRREVVLKYSHLFDVL